MNNTTFDIGGVESPQATGGKKLEHIAETATYTSPGYATNDCRAFIVDLVMRVVGTGSVTVSIERYDKASDTWVSMLASAAIVGNGSTRIKVTPDMAAVANSIAQEHLPETVRVVVTHNNANATTYSLTGTLTH